MASWVVWSPQETLGKKLGHWCGCQTQRLIGERTGKQGWISVLGTTKFMVPLCFFSNFSSLPKEEFFWTGPVLGHWSGHCLEVSVPLLCGVRVLACMGMGSSWSLLGSWDQRGHQILGYCLGGKAHQQPLLCISRSLPGCGQLPSLLTCWDRWPSPVLLSLWGQTFCLFHFLLFAIKNGRCSHSHISGWSLGWQQQNRHLGWQSEVTLFLINLEMECKSHENRTLFCPLLYP